MPIQTGTNLVGGGDGTRNTASSPDYKPFDP